MALRGSRMPVEEQEAHEGSRRPTRRQDGLRRQQEVSRGWGTAMWTYGRHKRTSAPSRTPRYQACAFGLGAAFFLALADLVALLVLGGARSLVIAITLSLGPMDQNSAASFLEYRPT